MGGVLGGEPIRPVGKGGHHGVPLPVQLDGQGVLPMAQGVGEQVGEDPGHRPAVCPHRGHVWGDVHLHDQAALLNLLVGGRQLVGQRPAQIHLIPLQGQLPSLDPGQVIEGGDEGLEGSGPPLDHRQVLHPFPWRQPLPLQQLQIAQDGGQRRAQVVGHVGDLLPQLLFLPMVDRPLLLAQLQQLVEADQQLLRPGAGAGQGEAGGGLVGHLLPHPAGGPMKPPLQRDLPPDEDGTQQGQQDNQDGFHKSPPFSRQMILNMMRKSTSKSTSSTAFTYQGERSPRLAHSPAKIRRTGPRMPSGPIITSRTKKFHRSIIST